MLEKEWYNISSTFPYNAQGVNEDDQIRVISCAYFCIFWGDFLGYIFIDIVTKACIM